MNPIIFVILTVLSFGAWTAFHKLASPYINQIFWAIFVSFTVVIIGTIWLLPQLKNIHLVTDSKGVFSLALAGVCAFFIDLCALKAYSGAYQLSLAAQLL